MTGGGRERYSPLAELHVDIVVEDCGYYEAENRGEEDHRDDEVVEVVESLDLGTYELDVMEYRERV